MSVNPPFTSELRRRNLVCDDWRVVGRGDQARAQLQAQRQVEAQNRAAEELGHALARAIIQSQDNAFYDALTATGLQMMSGSQPRAPAFSPMRECSVTHTGFQHDTVDCW